MYTHFSTIPAGAVLLTVAASLALEAHIVIVIPVMAMATACAVLRENGICFSIRALGDASIIEQIAIRLPFNQEKSALELKVDVQR
jgi:hypothetical protein